MAILWGMTSNRTRALLQYDSNLADDTGRALVVRYYVIEDFTQFLQIELICREKSLCGLRVAQDGGQGLVQLVNQYSRALVGTRALPDEQSHAAPAASPLRDERGDQHQLNDRRSGQY
jgi:hypothetical protein